MRRKPSRLAAACLALAGLVAALPAAAQKQGGILRVYHRDSPPSASIHEEATNSTTIPFMGVYNNLVVFDQHVVVNSLDSIVPDLAESWSWSADNTQLTFKLRQGVKWHDGKPFTAADVKCTWDMLAGRGATKLRRNPREAWYFNLEDVTTNGDFEAVFKLKRPQPSILVLLASGNSPVYPCHINPNAMRTKPIGTGPFKVADFKPNDSVKLVRNPDYWKKGLPYLDGIEFNIVKNRSTAILAFVSGQFDLTFPYEVSVPLVKDLKSQDPTAICETHATNVTRNVMVNREYPPFDKIEIRRAMSLALNRQAFVDILTEGQGALGGTMLEPPDGVWGLPPEILKTLPGYSGDHAKDLAEAQRIMRANGYGPENRLKVKVSARNIAIYRDPAVIVIDQLKEIFIDGELEVIETANWYPKVTRKDYAMVAGLTGNSVDDPDQNFYENYTCDSDRNYTYCDKEMEKLYDQQSMELDQAKRKKLVWEIDRRLQEDAARPVLYHNKGGTCWKPYVKNYTVMSNSAYNGFRFEDVWLDR